MIEWLDQSEIKIGFYKSTIRGQLKGKVAERSGDDNMVNQPILIESDTIEYNLQNRGAEELPEFFVVTIRQDHPHQGLHRFVSGGFQDWVIVHLLGLENGMIDHRGRDLKLATTGQLDLFRNVASAS